MSSLSDDKALDARIQAMVEARIRAMVMSGAPQLPSVINNETLLDAKQVLGPVLGNRSDMWLWRRQNDPDPEKKFPDPDVVIAGRRYWYFGTVRAWLAKQAANGKTRGGAGGEHGGRRVTDASPCEGEAPPADIRDDDGQISLTPAPSSSAPKNTPQLVADGYFKGEHNHE